MSQLSKTTVERVDELLAMSYQCSQVIVIMGLEARGQSNPALIKAVAGLSGGCGDGSCTCGCLTGACCLLALNMEQQGLFQEQQRRLAALSTELVRWFWENVGFPLGGIDCMAIREANLPGSPSERCRDIIAAVYQKVQEIIIINKIDVNWENFPVN